MRNWFNFILGPSLPESKFEVLTKEGEPMTLYFKDRSEGDIVNWSWDFGNGKKGEGKEVSHKYDDVGTYVVRLVVTYRDGLKNSSSSPPLILKKADDKVPVPTKPSETVPVVPVTTPIPIFPITKPSGPLQPVPVMKPVPNFDPRFNPRLCPIGCKPLGAPNLPIHPDFILPGDVVCPFGCQAIESFSDKNSSKMLWLILLIILLMIILFMKFGKTPQ